MGAHMVPQLCKRLLWPQRLGCAGVDTEPLLQLLNCESQRRHRCMLAIKTEGSSVTALGLLLRPCLPLRTQVPRASSFWHAEVCMHDLAIAPAWLSIPLLRNSRWILNVDVANAG